MKRLLTISVLLLLFSPSQLFSQRKVLGYPKAYVAPLNPYDNNSQASFTNASTQKDKVRHRGWWVIVDRAKVQAHAKPNEGAEVLQTLDFAQSFFVTDTEGNWLYLVDAVVDKTSVTKINKKIGWVHKDKLLLWNEGLLNPRTKIHLKALLLNKFDNFDAIPCDKKEIVKVYLDPVGTELRNTLSIYRFYFVYKKQGDRYLLGEIPALGRYDTGESLLGWVNKSRLAEWNTRIALEPNYTEAAYKERKSNKNFQVVAFKDRFAAEECANEGTINSEYITWQRDPVTSPSKDLAKSDQKRFRGDFMRFPLLSIGGQGKGGRTLPFYKSAICDEILVKIKCLNGKTLAVDRVSMAVHGDAVKYLEGYQKAAENFNIFFVVEGSSEMIPYQEEIINLSDDLFSTIKSQRSNARIKFGAVTYKDITENENPDLLLNNTELSSDKSAFQRFIRNADFSSPNSNFNYPVQNYGIYKALQIADFSPNHTNIVITIGNKGDFTYDRLLRKKYSASKANVDTKKLTDAINAGSVNLIGIQCNGNQLQSYQAFPRKLRGTILEAARKNYNNKFVSNTESRTRLESIGYQMSSPEMKDPDEVDDSKIPLENGTLKGDVFRITQAGSSLSANEISKHATKSVQFIVDENIKLYSELERWKYGEITPSDGFSPKMAEILMGIYTKTDANVDWTQEKFELYKPVYFARNVDTAQEPLFSYVLFWPKRDLTRYYAFVEKLVVDMSNISISDKRIKLKDAYCKLLEEFTGGEHDKDCTEYSIDEIFQIIQGVEQEGVEFSFNGKKISCLLDKRCTSDIEIEEMIQRFVDVKVYLGDLVKGSRNEFVFNRGGESFFWIKLEDIY